METKNYFSTDAAGNIIPSAKVYLYQPGTQTPVSGITNINGQPLANPFTAGTSGLVQFKAPDGEYDLRVVGGGREFTIRIQCFDGVAFKAEFDEFYSQYRQTGEVFASWFGAKLDGSTDDTISIQNAIDFCSGLGGGRVVLARGVAKVSATQAVDPILAISPSTGLTTYAANTQACVLVRTGVTLVGQGKKATKIYAPGSPNLGVVVLYDMDGGGLQSLGVRGGKGVISFVSDFSKPMKNLDLDDLEIYESTSYGIGMQYGVYKNNKYTRLYIHDTAQDAFDHKARASESTGEVPHGIVFDKILCERYGQASGSASAGLDVRGHFTMSNIECRDFYVAGSSNIGLRLSTGVYNTTSGDKRVPASKSVVTGFKIDSGNASGAGSVGLEIREADSVVVSSGVIENCLDHGVFVNQSAAGNGTGQNVTIANVSVIGSRLNAFATNEPGTSYVGCKALQADDRFAVELGNLAVGQTVIPVPRTFDPATVGVIKNGALLALTTDYTLTGSTAVNLVAAAISTDEFTVFTPTAIGFDIVSATARSATDALVSGCSTIGVTTPLRVAASCLSTFIQAANNFKGTNQLRFSLSGANIEAVGPGADVGVEILPKGNGSVTLRARGGRSFVSDNPASAVNWVQTSGSATATAVSIAAQGSDTDIDFRVVPKGAGRVRYGTLTASADAPITGYVEIKDAGGTVRKLAVIA